MQSELNKKKKLALCFFLLGLLCLIFLIVRSVQGGSQPIQEEALEHAHGGTGHGVHGRKRKVDFLKLHTSYGDILFQFFPQEAPITAAQYKDAFANGFYRNCSFYRYEPGFCLQGGCGKGFNEGTLAPVANEYHIPNTKGMVSTARTSDPNSATSEFSIMLGDNSKWLGPGGSDPYGYTVFMRVVSGWNAIQAIMSDGKNYERTPFLSLEVYSDTCRFCSP